MTGSLPIRSHVAILALLVGLLTRPAAAQLPWMNTQLSAEARTELLLDAMTLEQKIQQIANLPLPNEELPGCGTTDTGRHIEGIPELAIPTFRAANGGNGIRGGDCVPEPIATGLPSTTLGAATFNRGINLAWGMVLGQETRNWAHHVLLGPALNLIRHPYTGRGQEYPGEDPYLAGVMGVLHVKGIQSRRTHAMIKHFATNEDEAGDFERWTRATRVPARAMHELYLLPFEMAVKDGDAAAVMCAYPHLNFAWACENQDLMIKTLRQRWGFDGYVESDRRAMQSTAPSILARTSVELDERPEWYSLDKVMAALQAGEITEDDIDELVRLRFVKMFEFGHFDDPYNRFLPTDFASHAVVARRAAEEGIVLLKNEQNFLPLRNSIRSVALIGAEWFAGMAALPPRNGDPAELTTVVAPFTVTPEQGLKNTLAEIGSKATVTYNNGSDIASAIALAQRSEVVILMVGTTPRETRDLRTLSLPVVPAMDPPEDTCNPEVEECPETPPGPVVTDQEALVRAIAAANPNTVVVLKTSGMVLMPWLNQVPALLEAWFPGQHDGDAVADVLFGVITPSGKLPVTFGNTAREAAYATEVQYPGVHEDTGIPGGPGREGTPGEPQLVTRYTEDLQMGYRWYEANNVTPLFPFGFGLSYTTFGYSDLSVTPEVNPGTGRAVLTVSYTITNTGNRRGAEASQVYVTLPAVAGEPSKRLVGFEKVNLAPGASRRVSVTIDESASNHPLSYFAPDPNGTWAEGSWLTASGSYTVHVGTSSADTPLEETVDLSFPPIQMSVHIDTANTPSRWVVATTQRLAWTYAGNAATFQIEISRDGGKTWNSLTEVNNEPGNTQEFLWTVQGPPTSTARFRVTAVGDPGATDVNDADILIASAGAGGTIEIQALSGPVSSGSLLTIFYTHNLGNAAPVAIDISADDGETWMPVAETVTTGSTTSSFRFTVDLPPTSRARVRVRSMGGGGAEGTSSAFQVTDSASGLRKSAHVYLGEEGRLVYVPYANGDRIPDFSFAGYGGGGVAIPMVATAVTVYPIEGDDGANIQAAIDQVSALDPDADGFRGAVLLTAGRYQVAGSLRIGASGVVLRGEGDQLDGTIIRAVGTSRRNLITASGVANRTEIPGTQQPITDTYVPVGAFSFTVADASGFAVGDDVLLTRTPNQAWIDAIGMDRCTTVGTAYDTSDVSGRTCLTGNGVSPWTPDSRVIRYERRITSIEANRITIDAPTMEAIQQEFGGGYLAKYEFPGRIQKVGIEFLRSVSDYVSDTDEQHAVRMIVFGNVQDAWVRNVTSRFFEQGTVVVRAGGKYVTIQDSASLDHKSLIAGDRRYPFGIDGGSFVLVMRSLARTGRHDFVTGANTPGPNVFLDSMGQRSYSELGPHQRWATGSLYDRIRHQSVSRTEIIGVYNRGNSGTGHGWSGAYQLFWNCVGDTHRVSSPPHARNWSIGCQALRRQGNGEFEWFGEPVAPSSLYLQQLRDRLGEEAVANIGYGPDDRPIRVTGRG